MTVTPFLVPEDLDLTDLHARLRSTRFPTPTPGGDWAAGMPPVVLRGLVEHWLERYDWPEQARRLNRYPHAIADVPDGRLHYVRTPNPGAPEIVLLHGWPYTFAEMLPLADELAADFEVVAPSLPGFVFSPPLGQPFAEEVLSRMVDDLMAGVLGHERYLTYGEDVGTWVSDRLAGNRPDHVAGIVATHPAYPPQAQRAAIGPEAVRFFADRDALWARERGYSEIQSTKPDTLAAAVGDSPAGLAAWVVEKFHTWSDDDTTFPLDDLITTVMLFWITDSIGTSFRAYFEDPEQPPQPPITVPAAVAPGQADRGYPRVLAEHTYQDIRSFEQLPHGGHFVAREVPEEVARIVRALAAEL